jgi:hypothetical protein
MLIVASPPFRNVRLRNSTRPDADRIHVLARDPERDLVRIGRAPVILDPRRVDMGRREPDVNAPRAALGGRVLEHEDDTRSQVYPRELARHVVLERAPRGARVGQRHAVERLVGRPQIADPAVGQKPVTGVREAAVAIQRILGRSDQNLLGPPLVRVPAGRRLPGVVPGPRQRRQSTVEDRGLRAGRLDPDRRALAARQGGGEDRGRKRRARAQKQAIAAVELADRVRDRAERRLLGARIGVVADNGIDMELGHRVSLISSLALPATAVKPAIGSLRRRRGA